MKTKLIRIPAHIPLFIIKEAIAKHVTIGEKKLQSPDNHKLTSKGGYSVEIDQDGDYRMVVVAKESTGWVATIYYQFSDEDGFGKQEGYFVDVENSRDLKQVAKEVNLQHHAKFKVDGVLQK